MSAKKSYFKKIQNFRPDYAVAEFTQYESERTGMRIAVVDRQGPKVNGYFTLATEIHDDSGAPHTLEHLIFMGSRSYKYKGVLDKLATRAYSVTNAWTATDHTAYTLDTAGWAGFAQILPVYLEHVLLPTLTDSACYTEVWHIDGSGNDAGVVYSEMQGVQNTQSELMELQARRILYPEGNGFRYETGGMMEALRVLTTDRIRQFHKEMYQPKNLRLVLIGEIDHEELLDILDEFEDSIVEEMPPIDAPFKRPWIDSAPTPPLEESVIKTVEFPEDDESSGEILIGFFGPEFKNTVEGAAMDVLLTYIAGSSVSPLENTLVEKEELCSAVYHYQECRPNSVIWFTLSSVGTEALAAVEQRFFEVLRDATNKPLDMDYMIECIKRYRRGVVYAAEASNAFFSEPFIEDHLFGERDGKEFEDAVKTLKVIDDLQEWSDQRWRDFLSKYLAHNKHVSILGVPSRKLSEKLKADETARVKAQQEKLGEEGLKELARKLEEAKAHNDREIPREILAGFKVPSPESIHFIPSLTAKSGIAKKTGGFDEKAQKLLDHDRTDLPLFIHFEHVPTNFLHFNLLLSTSSVPLELKPLLSLYGLNFLTTAVMRDGKRIEFEDVVKQLEKDTISYNFESESELGNPELIRIRFVVEREKYETAVKWVRDLCFNSVFDPERLKPTLAKILADIPEAKRDGAGMLTAVNYMVHFSPHSNGTAQNTLVKALYLKRISHMLATNPEEVVKKLEDIRKSLFTFSNMRVFCIADLNKTERPVSTWRDFVEGLDTSEALKPLDTRAAVLSDVGRKPGNTSFIVPMATIDSSFAHFTAKGVDSYSHPKLPALMVAIAYLDAVEGPLWVAVRGTGLAYGTRFARLIDTGLVKFIIYRSPDAYKAYATAKEVVSEFASGKRDFDEFALEGAVSTIVMSFAEEQPTMISAAVIGFVNQVVNGIPKEWSSQILKQVRSVTPQEMREVMNDILLPVFNPTTTNMVVTCATIMEEGLVENFSAAGFTPEVRTLASFQEDYGLKPVDGEGDADADDEDEVDDVDGEEDSGSEDEEEEGDHR